MDRKSRRAVARVRGQRARVDAVLGDGGITIERGKNGDVWTEPPSMKPWRGLKRIAAKVGLAERTLREALARDSLWSDIHRPLLQTMLKDGRRWRLWPDDLPLVVGILEQCTAKARQAGAQEKQRAGRGRFAAPALGD